MPHAKPHIDATLVPRSEPDGVGVCQRLPDARHTQKDEEKEIPELRDRPVLVGH